jgi:hypothetical protein
MNDFDGPASAGGIRIAVRRGRIVMGAVIAGDAQVRGLRLCGLYPSESAPFTALA